MQGILYEEASFLPFLILTVLIGGWAAWQTGRATAQTWRPLVMLIPYAVGLGLAVRFLHFAVFGGTLLSLQFFIIDTAIIALATWLGFRWKRSEQMATQYSWLFDRVFPIGWRDKAGS
jgi:hypothetical protein